MKNPDTDPFSCLERGNSQSSQGDPDSTRLETDIQKAYNRSQRKFMMFSCMIITCYGLSLYNNDPTAALETMAIMSLPLGYSYLKAERRYSRLRRQLQSTEN